MHQAARVNFTACSLPDDFIALVDDIKNLVWGLGVHRVFELQGLLCEAPT
jgi:hypothetical protein